MPFSTFGGAVVASPQGQPSVLYMIRNDTRQIVALDQQSIQPIESWVRWRQFDGNDPTVRKRLVKVTVWGTGTLPEIGGITGDRNHCIMVVTADENHSDSYVYSVLAGHDVFDGNPSYTGYLWEQGIQGMQGRVFDIALGIRASNLQIKRVECEFTIIG